MHLGQRYVESGQRTCSRIDSGRKRRRASEVESRQRTCMQETESVPNISNARDEAEHPKQAVLGRLRRSIRRGRMYVGGTKQPLVRRSIHEQPGWRVLKVRAVQETQPQPENLPPRSVHGCENSVQGCVCRVVKTLYWDAAVSHGGKNTIATQ